MPHDTHAASDRRPGGRDAMADRWRAASDAARKAEHHWPADCLAEAAEVVLRLTSQLAAVEAMADEWDAAVEPDGSTSYAPVRSMAAELRARIKAGA